MARHFAIGLCVTIASLAAGTTEACNTYRTVVYRPVSYVSRTVEVVEPAPVVKVVKVETPTIVKVVPSKPQVTAGSTITASANFLGAETGRVFLQMGSATIDCEIVLWGSSQVTFKLPNLGLNSPVAASLELVRGDGRTVRNFAVDVTARPALVEVQDAAALAVAPEAPGAPFNR